MRLRSLIARPIKWAFARAGYDIVSQAVFSSGILVSRDAYGHDAFLDIERLSQAWRYSIDVFFDVGANDGGTIRLARHRFDLAQRSLCQERKLAPPDWRIMLGINGAWQGGIQSPDQTRHPVKREYLAYLSQRRWSGSMEYHSQGFAQV